MATTHDELPARVVVGACCPRCAPGGAGPGSIGPVGAAPVRAGSPQRDQVAVTGVVRA